MDNSVIAKSGWLHRKGADSAWERNWVELYRDGYLKYYESDHSPNAEDVIFMPSECRAIKTGSHVGANVMAPRHLSNHCYFSVTASNDKNWHFCGETVDDMRAWQLALEQSRLLIVRPNARDRVPYQQLLNPQFGGGHSGLHHHRPHNPYLTPYGSLPPTYMPAFTDGSLTFVPSYTTSGSNFHPQTSTTHSHQHLNRFDSGFPLNTPHPSFQELSHFGRTPHDQTRVTNSGPLPNPMITSPDSRDVAMGMLAGAAVGSMMWGPYFWW